MPVENKDAGYDLVVGDWIAPHGKGEKSDVVFNIKINKVGEGHTESYLKVSFPGVQNGMVSFDAPIENLKTSRFRSGYEAPLDGYERALTHTRVRRDGKADQNTRERTKNYYIRIRTELDSKGNIVSAQYGKIYGDFMRFTHYLNPTPNDRNVKFDPKKNLLNTGRRRDKVQAP